MAKERKSFRLLLCVLMAFILITFIPMNAHAISFVPLSTDGQWIDGNISAKGEVDYYSVSIPSAGWLTVDFQGFSVADSYIQIWDVNLTNCYESHEIYTSSDINPKTHTDEIALEPGTYVLKVYAYGDNTGNYRLKALFKAAGNNESANNNNFNTAQNLGIGQAVTGFISRDDRVDFYKVNIANRQTLKFITTCYARDIYITIYNKDFIQTERYEVYYGAEDSPKTHDKELDLTPGTYYIKVEPYGDCCGRYVFKVDKKILINKLVISGKKEIAASKKTKLKTKIAPANADNKELEWSTSNSSIASVSNTGNVTAYRAGKVTIYAKTKDGSNKTAKFQIIVKPKRMSAPSGGRSNQSTIYFSWYTQSGVSGYEIQYATNSAFKGAKAKKIASTKSSVRITGMYGDNYYVRIRAYYKYKGKKYYSKWSPKKNVSTKQRRPR